MWAPCAKTAGQTPKGSKSCDHRRNFNAKCTHAAAPWGWGAGGRLFARIFICFFKKNADCDGPWNMLAWVRLENALRIITRHPLAFSVGSSLAHLRRPAPWRLGSTSKRASKLASAAARLRRRWQRAAHRLPGAHRQAATAPSALGNANFFFRILLLAKRYECILQPGMQKLPGCNRRNCSRTWSGDTLVFLSTLPRWYSAAISA